VGSKSRISYFGLRVYCRVRSEEEDTDGMMPYHKRIESAQRLESRVKGVVDTVARFSVTEHIARV